RWPDSGVPRSLFEAAAGFASRSGVRIRHHRTMTRPERSLGSPAVTLGLATLLVSLLVLALAAGLLGGRRPVPTGSPGQVAGSSGPSSGPTTVPTLGYPTPSPEPTFMSYEVRVGDTLNSIAKAFRTTARSLA